MMINGATVNSGMVNGASVRDSASSPLTDGRHTISAGRNRLGIRHRGTSLMLIFENKDYDATWVLELIQSIARKVGRRKD